eukprot:scaffold1341_cov178-Amphora_coffeaeformis.AAC.1
MICHKLRITRPLLLLPCLFVLVHFLKVRVVLEQDVMRVLQTDYHQGIIPQQLTLQEQHPYGDTESAIISSSHHPHRPRLLLFVGPHKTASTTIQSFLSQLNNHFNNKKNPRHEQGNENGFYLVEGHPLVPKTLLVPPTWKRLWKQSNKPEQQKVNEDDEQELLQWIHDKGAPTRQYLSSWNATKSAGGIVPAPLLVWAQENFDILAGLGDNDEDIRQALAKIWKWFGTDELDVEVVVMYRTPRTDHLISMWKESMAVLPETKYPWRTKVLTNGQSVTPKKAHFTLPTLAEWMCTGVWPGMVEYNVTLQLATWINPWGLAHALHKHLPAAKVTIVNMAGVGNQDIPSMVACEFLQFHSSCVEVDEAYNSATNNKEDQSKHGPLPTRTKTVETIRKINIPNFTYHKVVNAKNNPPGPIGFADDDLTEAERILREMDCYYFCELGKTIFTDVEGRSLDRSFSTFRIMFHDRRSFFGGDDMRQSWENCCRQTESVKEKGVSLLDGTATAERLRNLACRAHHRRKQRTRRNSLTPNT